MIALLSLGFLAACAAEDWDGTITPTITTPKPNVRVQQYQRVRKVWLRSSATEQEKQALRDAIAMWNRELPQDIFTIQEYVARHNLDLPTPPPLGDVILYLITPEQMAKTPGGKHPVGSTLNIGEHGQSSYVRVVDDPHFRLSDTIAHELGHTLFLPDETSAHYSVPYDRSVMAAYASYKNEPPLVVHPRHIDWILTHYYAPSV